MNESADYKRGLRDGFKDGFEAGRKSVNKPQTPPYGGWRPADLPGFPGMPQVKCSKCGMVWQGAMGYSCPHAHCPVQPKATM